MKTPCNHPKLVWASHGAYAAVGAVVVLLCRAALGQTIPNPSFEADTFTTFPGYISVNAPITGWTANPTDEVGLNPAGDNLQSHLAGERARRAGAQSEALD